MKTSGEKKTWDTHQRELAVYFITRYWLQAVADYDLIGRVNVGGNFDSPFEVASKEIDKLKREGVNIIIVEIHAEATAEKICFSKYLT